MKSPTEKMADLAHDLAAMVKKLEWPAWNCHECTECGGEDDDPEVDHGAHSYQFHKGTGHVPDCELKSLLDRYDALIKGTGD